MAQRVIKILIAFFIAGLLCSALSPAHRPDRSSEVARAVLRHEKLLTDARFEIPTALYQYYLRDLRNPERPQFDSPIPYIAEEGTYHLAVKTVKAKSAATLQAKVRLRVFNPTKCLNLPIFGTKNVIWKDLTADNKAAKLTIIKGRVRFAATKPGVYTITGRYRLKGAVGLDVIPTVRTAVVFDSPGAWEVQAKGQVAGSFVGTAEKGTHGRLALKSTDRLSIEYSRPMPRSARPPIYSLGGDVVWNLGAAAQQVSAVLKATIASGPSDRIVLLLPGGADRVKVTGPEVRSAQVSGGRAVVYLRGEILGSTILNVYFERPAGAGGLGRFGAEGGRWTGGTLIVTNSAGGSEILPASMTGLRQMSLSEVPTSAKAILSAPAVLAYEITSRDFSAEVEVLRLGEFALRESIADLAHYEVFLARDGAIICRVRYEIRNSNKQFLRLRLPAGGRVLLARVNEKSCPISPMPGAADRWLLPLERSRASVMGLVSFPVDVVFMCRTDKLAAEGVAEIPLPAIDLPIAYAWCETYFPAGMEVKKWSGVLRKVSRFSSETATASLDYGWGEMAKGYSEATRPKVKPTGLPPGPVARPILSKVSILDRTFTNRAVSSLARNYYRAGKAYYDKNEFPQAARYLEQVVKLAPGSTEADNAKRLLANPQMPKARELQTVAEKASAKVIERELAEQRRPLERRQEKLLDEAIKDVQAGREAEAKAKLATVQVLHRKLTEQKADVAKQHMLLKKSEPVMSQLRQQTTSRKQELRIELKKLKKSGKYEKALQVAGKLRRHSDEPDVYRTDGDDNSRAARLRRAEREKLQKEIAELAVSASRERQKKGKTLADVRKSPMPSSELVPRDWASLPARKPKPADKPTSEPQKPGKVVTRVYDIRDLVTRVPNFKGPKVDVQGNDSNAEGGLFGDSEEDYIADVSESRRKSTKDMLELVRSTVKFGGGVGGGGAIHGQDGKIVVKGSLKNQQAVADILTQLRRARGPQVQAGEKLAQQEAGGVIPGGGTEGGWGTDTGIKLTDKQLSEFIWRNYDWSLQGDTSTGATIPGGRQVVVGRLISKLRYNRGQKVVVKSINVNADARTAAALGVRFRRGGNNVNWSIINEAQFRSLMELDAEANRHNAKPADTLTWSQEAIVGTDARLSNKMTANVSFAGDKGNVLDVGGNAISLAHEGYLLLNINGRLTVVQAGAMQNWREKPTDIGFVEVPQNIEVPRVGQLFRFERTLLKTSDKMIIRAEYKQKGASR